ncbi:MAG: GGDEF domain-containing protein [Nitrospinota bacterium]|nr:MAG: GGDEF domain-containing protein [Nitrospinota bacterium]
MSPAVEFLTMDKRILLLRELSQREHAQLSPHPNLESSYGYWYPEAQAILETRPGEEVEHLDYLAGLGYLSRHFFDKIHLCPFCSHFALNFREVCPQCTSSHIEMVEMLHHFRCGYVAPEVEFRDGIRYTCPKCKHTLRHIGVDYEQPSTNYLCAACQHIFSEPVVSCFSLTCGQTFAVEKAIVRVLYTYRLTTQGVLAARRGVLEEAGMAGIFIDPTFGTYTFRFFEEQLAQEIRRARRYDHPLSLMITSPDHLEDYEAAFGKEAAASMVKAITLLIKESLRNSDIPALYGDRGLIILLSDTPLAGAYSAADRIRQQVLALNTREPKITLSVGLSSLTDGVESPQQLIDLAHQRLQEARQAGGDCVRPQP